MTRDEVVEAVLLQLKTTHPASDADEADVVRATLDVVRADEYSPADFIRDMGAVRERLGAGAFSV